MRLRCWKAHAYKGQDIFWLKLCVSLWNETVYNNYVAKGELMQQILCKIDEVFTYYETPCSLYVSGIIVWHPPELCITLFPTSAYSFLNSYLKTCWSKCWKDSNVKMIYEIEACTTQGSMSCTRSIWHYSTLIRLFIPHNTTYKHLTLTISK